MKALTDNLLEKYISGHVGSIHQKLIEILDAVTLGDLLKQVSLYQVIFQKILTAQDLVKTLLDAHLSSQEETIFGEFLEGLAIYVNGNVYGGKKSFAEGIDLEFTKDDIRYIIVIKSGPHWGNSRQIIKMKEDFKRTMRVLRTSNSKLQIVAINGCCYGRDNKPDKGDYYKYCGQKFWEFISGNESLYVDIIEPLGHKAKERNSEFTEAYAQIINKFTLEFSQIFCIEGRIDWNHLVRFNSSISPQKYEKMP